MLTLKEIPAGDIEQIVVKDLRAPGAFPMTFAELKSKSFPVSAFAAAKVCPRSVWPVPGDRLPVCLVQANFIQGGMILAWNIFHMFGDSVTFSVWSEVWAEECRRAQGEEISNPVDLPDRIITDREYLKKPSGRNAGRAEDHPEYLILPCRSPPQLPLAHAPAPSCLNFLPVN